MSILTHIALHQMTPGILASPGMVAYNSGTGGETAVALTSVFPGAPGWENTGNNTGYRAYDRVVAMPNSINGTLYHAWHKDIIYGLTASPTWTNVHTVTSQSTALDSGQHTGLYVVHSDTGDRCWLVGLYRTSANDIGYVKFDSLTNTWTSAVTTITHSTDFSNCVAWKGELLCPTAAGLHRFNPRTNTFSLDAYTGDKRDVITICNDRVFIASQDGSNNLNVLEYLGPSLIANWGTVTGTTVNSGAAGGWHWWDGLTNGVLYLSYYTTTGGTGWRLEKVEVTSSVRGATPTLSDLTDPVIPDDNAGVGRYRWGAASSINANASQEFICINDASEWPRGAFGTAGGAFLRIQLSAPGTSGDRYTTTKKSLAWNGEGTDLTFGSPSGTTNHSHKYSTPMSRWGTNELMFPGSSETWIETVSEYSDSTIAKGMLIEFRTQSAVALDVQFLTNDAAGEDIHAGTNPAPLSTGTALAIGGSATLDATDNSVDNITSGTLYQIIWDLTGEPDNVFRNLRPVTIPNGATRPPFNSGIYSGGPAIHVPLVFEDPVGDPGIYSSPVGVYPLVADYEQAQTDSPVVDALAQNDVPPPQNCSPVYSALAANTATSDINDSPVFEGITGDPYISNDIAFTVQVNLVIEKSVSVDIAFLANADQNFVIADVENSIEFGVDLDRNVDYGVSVENTIAFNQSFSPTEEAAVSSDILFGSEVARMENPTVGIAFDATAVPDVSKGISNDILFDALVAAGGDFTRDLDADIAFDALAVGYIADNCDLQEYSPWGVAPPSPAFGDNDQVTLSCAADSIILRNPTFGNQESAQVDRALNTSRGGTPNIVRDTQWPENTELNIRFEILTRAKALELLEFLENCIGLLVTYTDYENRQWEGIITNPEEAVVENASQGCGEYSANIILVGSPV